jgi:hypothetical protein
MNSINKIISYVNPLAKNEDNAQIQKPSSNGQKIRAVKIEVGSSWFLIDLNRNIFSIFKKIILWNFNVNSGRVSQDVIYSVRQYLEDNNLYDVQVSINQYKPQMIWKRTFTNPKTSILSKIFLGIPNCLFYTFSFDKLTGLTGDHYNPLTNTVHIYSNDLSIALHECGYAKDFNSRKNPSLYALVGQILSAIPVVGDYLQTVPNLSYEYIASSDAINYLKENDSPAEVKKAYKTLIPAYSTYVGGTLAKVASVAGYHPIARICFFGSIIIGHIVGRTFAYLHDRPKAQLNPAFAV